MEDDFDYDFLEGIDPEEIRKAEKVAKQDIKDENTKDRNTKKCKKE